MEYNDKIAFHPGYYIEELVEESGLTQRDFAKRLDTTAKNLSILIRGEQRLSVEMAMKLSRMIGTSVEYWLNLQNAYDALIAEFDSDKELIKEREVFKAFNYKYFREHFGLKDFPRKVDKQIKELREFLEISTLSVLKKKDMAVNFRKSSDDLSEQNIIKANTMVQIATNIASKQEAPKFNKKKFEEVVEYALTLTKQHEDFYKKVKKAFFQAGVIFVILPNIEGSKTNGATKKIGKNIMLMVNDRREYADSFWFTLFHEIGHIMNDDYGISFDREKGEQEEKANLYAAEKLIPSDKYNEFINEKRFDETSIKKFANEIKRDPGIVLGRLENDGMVEYNNPSLKSLKSKYKVGTY